MGKRNPPSAPLVAVVEAVEKPGNLGAILRTADAAHVDAVLVCDPRVDVWNPNVIRASRGAVFAVPVVEVKSPEALSWLRRGKMRVLATTGEKRTHTLPDVPTLSEQGIAGVVAVFVGVLSIAEGFRAAMTVSGGNDVAIVLRSGADNEMTSGLSREEVRLIGDAPGVARTAEGPMASAELFVMINLPKRSTGTDANVPLRGVGKAAMAVRGDLRILEGRTFEPGRNEVIVGAGAARAFAGLERGRKFRVGQNEWEVVGLFSGGGGAAESEIWTDAAVLQPAYNRGDSFQSVYAKLASRQAFEQFKEAAEAFEVLNDPQKRALYDRYGHAVGDALIRGAASLLQSCVRGTDLVARKLMTLRFGVYAAPSYLAYAGEPRKPEELLTQLYGDRLLIANATGCSSIYGGNLPTTPYAVDQNGRGPAWSNSLFEDNAEFGLGMRLALETQRQDAVLLVTALAWLVSRLIAWWSVDLLRGMSPMP